MLLPRASALLFAAASLTHAFKDASPFFLLSSEPSLHSSLPSAHLSTAADLESDLIAYLTRCEHQCYYFLPQPGVTTSHFHPPQNKYNGVASAMPKLQHLLQPHQLLANVSLVQVPNVLSGYLDLARVSKAVEDKCPMIAAGCKDARQGVWIEDEVATRVMPMAAVDGMNGVGAKAALGITDDFIADLLATELPRPYVVVYAASAPNAASSSSSSGQQYEMDEPSPLHTDLKRDLFTQESRHGNSSSKNHTDNAQAGLPLFEVYQFLSPGVFMGLAVSLLLFLILWVAVSAIAGLEVSYKAFDKEMGPQAQNKGK